MLSIIRTVIYVITLFVFVLPAWAEGGKVIFEPKEYEEQVPIDYPDLYREYLRELDVFDEKYPDDLIDENFADDILELHPEYTDKQAMNKMALLRIGVRGRRTYRHIVDAVKDFLLENEIPLRFDDDQYEMGENEEYQQTDKPLVIKDFKKVVAYSNAQRDILAAEDKRARDAGRPGIAERREIIKKAFLARDWKTLLFYGLLDGTALEDNRGIGEWAKTPELQSRLLTSTKDLGKGKISGALQLYASPGWFLLAREYQNNPGLKVEFAASANLAQVNLNWPLPKRYFINLEQSFIGYPGLVTVPFELNAADASKPLNLLAKVNASLCNDKDGCRQVSLQPELELQPGEQSEPSNVSIMLRMMSNYAPHETDELRLKRLVVEGSTPQVLRLEAEADGAPARFEVFVEGDGAEEFAPPLVRLDGSKIVARFAPLNPNETLVGREFTIAAGTSQTVSVRQKMTAVAASLLDAESPHLSLGILALAFLGGLLLNVMPCVFPVLALKIMAFTRFGALDMRKIRITFCANLLGIAAAFAMLIAILIGLKLLGRAVGWGMQFQSTGFLTVMVFVISAFIAHLWGLIHIPAPEKWNNIINQARGEFVVQFLNGAFLVLLSSSCSAPYLGTALGLALAGTPVQIAAVVACVGLGLAMPYVLFAVFPAAAYYMPRPGKWLRLVNRLMFIMLFATLWWLLALLAAQGGSALWWQFALFILAFWFVLYIRRLAMQSLDEQVDEPDIYAKLRRWFNMAALALLASLVFWGWRNAAAQVAEQHRELPSMINYDEIRSRLGQKQSVLVKIGADWCLTCGYNNFAAFEDPQVQQLLTNYNVEVIEVDWTDYNPEVLDFMQKFGRSGLPFYIIFTPRIPGGIVLPEILNEQDLRALLEELHR